MNRTVYVCEECGSTDIQCVAWVYVNTNVIADTYGDGDVQDLWCDKCDAHTHQITEAEYKQNQEL